MSRILGITHKCKKTRNQEARPTQVAIIRDGVVQASYDLETETNDEMDFLKKRFAIEWRKLTDDEDVHNWFSEGYPQGLRFHQCKKRKLKAEELGKKYPTGRVHNLPDGKGILCAHLITQVPIRFDGLIAGDQVAMLLGGSGGRYAAALSKQGEKIGALVYRIPPNNLKQLRGEADEANDHATMGALLEKTLASSAHDTRPFHQVRLRDRNRIRIRETLALRHSAQEDRKACANRVRSNAEGRIYCNEEGMWPDGLIEGMIKQELANDTILQGLEQEEAKRDAELARAVKQDDLWDQLFGKIEGCGPRIAAGLISAIGDIRRFWVEPDPQEMQRLYEESQRLELAGNFEADINMVQKKITDASNRYHVLQLVRSYKRKIGKEAEATLLDQAIACHRQRAKLRHLAKQRGAAKLAHYVGVFVKKGGVYGDTPTEEQFPRRRRGPNTKNNWVPAARQTLVLLADQFNRRPKSTWGVRRIACKIGLRERHPEPVEITKEDGKRVTRYTNGHIHKMSAWSSLSKFVRFVFKEWTRIEEEAARKDNGKSSNGGK